MLQYVIMCRSLTYAQRAVSALEKSGITVATFRAPKKLTNGGCGYCIKVAERRFHDALQVLELAGIPYGRIFRKGDDGGYSEVIG